MKKALALVFAVTMLVSLVTVTVAKTAGTGFTDDDTISAEYDEAVQVLDQLGVLQKNADGALGAKELITRAEAAVLVYRIATGDVNDTGVKLWEEAVRFADVPSTYWASGYINYCAAKGYIKGTTATTFEPEAYVTGLQAIAMMLRALGYDVNDEFTAGDWQTNVANVAAELKLESSVANIRLSDPVVREVVAQILYDAFRQQYVSYTAASGYQRLQPSGNPAALTEPTEQMSGAIFRLGGKSDVRKDAYGQPYYCYAVGNKADAITIWTDPVATYTDAVTAETVKTLTGTAPVFGYEDGRPLDAEAKSMDELALVCWGGNGTVTELYDLAAPQEAGAEARYTLVIKNQYVGQVTGIDPDTGRAAVRGLTEIDGRLLEGIGPTGLTAGEIVLYYLTYDDGEGYSIVTDSVHPAEEKQVTLSGTYVPQTGEAYLLTGEQQYFYSRNAVAVLDRDTAEAQQKLYFDDAGYVIYAASVSAPEPAETTYRYGYLLARYGSYGSYVADNQYVSQFSVLLEDGTAATIEGAISSNGKAFYYATMSAAYQSTAQTENKLYAYTRDESTGLYALKLLGDAPAAVKVGSSDAWETYTLTGRLEEIPVCYQPAFADTVLDDESVFILQQYDEQGIVTGYQIIRGAKKLPVLEGSAVRSYVIHDGKTAKLVYVTGCTATSAPVEHMSYTCPDDVFYQTASVPVRYYAGYDAYTVVDQYGQSAVKNYRIDAPVPTGFVSVSQSENGLITETKAAETFAFSVAGAGVIRTEDGQYVNIAPDGQIIVVNDIGSLTVGEVTLDRLTGKSDLCGVCMARDGYGMITRLLVASSLPEA